LESRYAYCETCDFAFCSNPPTDQTLAEYYATNDQYRRDMLTVEEARHILGQVRFISRYFRPRAHPARVLEIGADFGAFLSAFTQELGASGYFDELNKEARCTLLHKGFSDVYHSEHVHQRFDLIVMRHVFEHVADPATFLQSQIERLLPGGYIFIEVPDYSALVLGGSDTFQFEHLSYFSLRSLTSLATRQGCQVIASEAARTAGYSTTPNQVARLILEPVGKQANQPQSFADWQSLMTKTLEDFEAIDRFIQANEGARFALYGAGTRTLEFIANTRCVESIRAIYDKDPKKIGTQLCGITVASPEQLRSERCDFVLLMVIGYEREVRDSLASMGIPVEKIISLKSNAAGK
jgi:2-polyprenyl-3-methyl-5-hydroxy-6-metoxy-1,4-benzoquinol methylase